MGVDFCRIKRGNLKCLIFVLVFVLVFATLSPIIVYTVSYASKCTIVLDAGHGGRDVGVVGDNTGIKESELNLILVRLIGEYLKGGGYRVVYTRTNDTQMEYEGIYNNHKRADMYARRDVILNAKPSAVVSIHMNYYSLQRSRRGAQVFYDRKSEQGVRFARIMQSMLNKDINSIGNGREYAPLSAEKYILSCTPYPSIIIECGFLSNPFDEHNLVDGEYQLLIAKTIANGIIEYLSLSTV